MLNAENQTEVEKTTDAVTTEELPVEMPEQTKENDQQNPQPAPVDLNPVTTLSQNADLSKTKIFDDNKSITRQMRRVDEFVRGKLNYANLFELYEILTDEQIDAIATAIYAIEEDKQNSIIANLISAGNSIVIACIVRYLQLRDKKVLIISEQFENFNKLYIAFNQAGLDPLVPQEILSEQKEEPLDYTTKDIVRKIEHDIEADDFELPYDTSRLFKKGYEQETYACIEKYRELYFSAPFTINNIYQKNADYKNSITGKNTTVPFIINAHNITDAAGNIIYKSLTGKLKKNILKTAEIPFEYDCVLLTYKQIQTEGSDKYNFIKSVTQNNFVIMDKTDAAIEQEPVLYKKQAFDSVVAEKEQRDLELKLVKLYTLIENKITARLAQAQAREGTIDPSLNSAVKKQLRHLLAQHKENKLPYKDFKTLSDLVFKHTDKFYYTALTAKQMNGYYEKYKNDTMKQYDYTAIADILLTEFGTKFHIKTKIEN